MDIYIHVYTQIELKISMLDILALNSQSPPSSSFLWRLLIRTNIYTCVHTYITYISYTKDKYTYRYIQYIYMYVYICIYVYENIHASCSLSAFLFWLCGRELLCLF